MLSNPRALPPVTHGSAFQAPECMWGTCDVTTLWAPERLWILAIWIPILIGQMLHIALCCLEGSTPEDRGLFLFIALQWMQEPCGVMMWLAENIQACLRIFRQAQHQWLARDILHRVQGVFYCFCLMASQDLFV